MEQKMMPCMILSEGFAETEDVADNDGYTDYYDDSPATHEILDYGWAVFFRGLREWLCFLGILMLLLDRKFFKNFKKPILQKSTSTCTVSIYLSKELQGQKFTSTYLPDWLIREYVR